jgi:hypothetical protein
MQIESNDICAEISASGSVTFSDPPPQFTKEQLDSVLGDIQQQTELLSMLEQEMGRSKEFLNKVSFKHFVDRNISSIPTRSGREIRGVLVSKCSG